MHPQVAQEIEKFFAANSNEEFLFVGIPLLFESNMQNLFDKIIFVYTDDDIRLERLLRRNNYTVEHAKAGIASQMPQEEKLKKSDFVINNNGSIDNLNNNISSILEQIRLM